MALIDPPTKLVPAISPFTRNLYSPSGTEIGYYNQLMVDWQKQYDKEIQQAEEARQAGNEGKARVCARRAAGHVIGEYLRRNGLAAPGSSAYTRLQYLRSLSEISPQAQEAAHHLLLRITPDHNLPVETDLIAKARWLREYLIRD